MKTITTAETEMGSETAGARGARHPGRHPGRVEPPRITATPMSEAFTRKYGVHAGLMGGEPIQKDLQEVWKGEVLSSDSSRPAVAYIHIPFCSSRCLFCGFYAHSSIEETMQAYTLALGTEIRASGKELKRSGVTLDAVYFGGGTPTDLSRKDLAWLVRTVRNELPLSDDCEVTIEGRLFGFDDEKVKAVLDEGANRFSLGVQSFNTQIRQRVGRKHTGEEAVQRTNRLVELSEAYRAAVIIDLIYGLPGQGEAEWLGDIDCAIQETGIHGLDLYQINMIPGTPLADKRDNLPAMADLSQQGDLFLAGRKRMSNAGFNRLSIAHWGRDPRERNRYNSWNKRGVNCLPLGSGAGGRWGAGRFFQEKDLTRYLARVVEGEKPLAMGMYAPSYAPVVGLAIGQMEQQVLDLFTLEKAAGRPLVDPLEPMMALWQEAGLISEESSACHRLTEAGEFWVVNLQTLMELELKRLLCET